MSDNWGTSELDDGQPSYALEVNLVGGAVIHVRVPHAVAAHTARERSWSKGSDDPTRADLAHWLGVYWAAIMRPTDHSLSILDADGVWWAVNRAAISHVTVRDTAPDASRPRIGFRMPIDSAWGAADGE